MRRNERVSYMMLFCALILVKNSKATLAESVTIVPLSGKARHLAGELLHQPTFSMASPVLPA